ncbi:DUF4333 domain-containing protein [Saccharomonospora azurea]|uniref:DUF4333 domain-containing protein n=1 Tax=Saccharomonospora azurea NA-128 TaxID=882081 RepID=H8GB48_9PSEU|nr:MULTISPECIES: DUF4333 domain-containing protein [Saccharomonospora]EHY90671.1 hypothetical protein SacazDRAFT_03811 [Saccharomonospora azurea NA-128]
MKLRSLRAVAVLAVGAAFALSGCSFKSTVSKEELEKQSFDVLTKMAGEEPAEVECPGPIDGEVGAKTRCVLTAKDGGRIGYTIEITSYEDNRGKMVVQVDETPMPPAQGNAGT